MLHSATANRVARVARYPCPRVAPGTREDGRAVLRGEQAVPPESQVADNSYAHPLTSCSGPGGNAVTTLRIAAIGAGADGADVVIVLGRAGQGKSTLAAALSRFDDVHLFSDDAVAVDPSAGRYVVTASM